MVLEIGGMQNVPGILGREGTGSEEISFDGSHARIPRARKRDDAKLAVGVGGKLGFVGDIVIKERCVGTFLEMTIVAQADSTERSP